MNQGLKQFVSVKFKKSGKALDLGAGEFFDVACLRQLGWKSEGVDLKTGVDLEKQYLSPKRPFDLVCSNFVIHKLKNPSQLVATGFKNLKKGGWFFLQTFDKSDKFSKSKFDQASLEKMLKQGGFKNLSAKIFDFYDNDEGHKHWHRVLEVICQKE